MSSKHSKMFFSLGSNQVVIQQHILRRSKMKHFTKTGSPPGFLALLVGAMLLGLVAQSALAAGTAVGTSISNSASLAYSVGGVGQTGINSAAVSFLVDEKVNLTVAGTGVAIPVVPNSTLQVATFTVTNNSNSPMDFSLAANQPVGGPAYLGLTDNFDATGCSVFVESGVTAGYQPLEDIATFLDEIPADPAVGSTHTVYVVCSIPSTVVNGNAAIVGLTATGRGDFTGANGTYAATVGTLGAVLTQTVVADTPGTVDIVFADIAGSEPGDGSRDARHSARDVYHVVTATLSVNKTALLLCDPSNGAATPKNIPGSITRWSIAIQNTGGAAATLTTITDTLDAALAHDANLVLGNSVANCDSATGAPESAANLGFKVTTTSGARNIGGVAAVSTHYFTTNTADGLDIAGQLITATFATILPADGGHATAGLLNSGEDVTITFNTVVQ
jgi:uncharacterized repeat protein (TIGR01451 family)